MSDNSDISDFESTIEDDIEEKSNSSRSSKKSSDDDEDDDPEMIDSVKASISKNKSFQRKNADGARIIRKVRYIYPPKAGEKDERISPRIMTAFELAALIGERAEMISKGGKIHPKYANYPTVDLIKIAALEIEDPTIPFPLMIKRPIDNPTHPTIVEIFKVRELLTPSQRLINYIEKHTPTSDWRVF